MKKVVSSFLCIILIAIATTACSLPTAEDLKGSTGASQANEQQNTNKYNAYIELANQINGGMYGSVFNNYVSKFGVEEEIYIDDKFDGFGTTPFIPSILEHVEGIAKYASAEPSYGATDERIQELIPIITDLMKTNNEIESYYTAKTYVDDHFEKGRELHKRFISLFEKYIEVGMQFNEDFSEITWERKYADAEQLKEGDMLIRYYALRSVLGAQEIQEAFYYSGVGDDNILDFDVKKYEELYQTLSEDIEHYFEHAKDGERRKKEAWPGLAIFKTSLEGAKVTATDILTILREQNPDINSETKGKVTTGGRNAILTDFDRKVSFLVDAYNTSINVTVAE
ncbi:YiiG family protein [Paenibacillus aceti]|uniref:DUF3829 domain-containing protein n=1 Tax=Paenibacillus aceti TaxID=1820010 RepID=A0ABQ1VWE0_9BACL|nr:YiiG family protein [Paenibacillus aceti]GGF99452.1 hypothetical protein GCM10010913_21570 [Paenibacillus aceti]